MAWHYKKYQDEQTTDDRVAYSDAELDGSDDVRVGDEYRCCGTSEGVQ